MPPLNIVQMTKAITATPASISQIVSYISSNIFILF